MGSGALASSGVTALILFLIKDRSLTDRDEPLRRVRKSRVWTWLALELVGFAATFVRHPFLLCALGSALICYSFVLGQAITQTKGAIGFPIVVRSLSCAVFNAAPVAAPLTIDVS
jgi:hypothetical protein